MILKLKCMGLLLPILFVLLMSRSNAFSDPPLTPPEILERIIQAERKVSYAGTRMTVINSPCGTTVLEERVLHYPPKIHVVTVSSILGDGRSLKGHDGERHQGDGRKTLGRRQGEKFGRRRRFPPRRQQMATLSQKEMELLERNYRFDFATAEAIAGHEIDLVTISPRLEGRPTKRLYLARDTGIILRAEDLHPDGTLRLMFVYTQISFEPEKVQQKLAELQRDGKQPSEKKRRRSQPITLGDARKVLDNRLVQPTYLPPGFQLLETRSIKHRSETVYLRYTDGLVTFSLFETKGPSLRAPRSRGEDAQVIQRHGVAVQLSHREQTHILQWFVAGVDFALMGELSQEEMVKVAESLILPAKK
ncbi:MAG: DUF4367 domain-containing protein [Candidatus Poribacteria bacterium]|nr:DUF4367 domain-containing protein [Candidatus Poribacteria bacterium]